MDRIPFEARVRKSSASSTSLLIRSGDIVVETEFAELAPCEFPVWTSSPVYVEIPPDGTKSFIVGPFSGSVSQGTTDGGYPHTIKFPVYGEQAIASFRSYQALSNDGAGQILAKVPIVALATAVSGVVDGKLIQTHRVLPIWNDGSSVLVTLDYFEGESAEGTPNPEWHMHASTGRPAALGLQDLAQASHLPANAAYCRYQLHATPWLLGAQFLNDQGTLTLNRIWQREWAFDSDEKFSNALNRITTGLLRPASSNREDAA